MQGKRLRVVTEDGRVVNLLQIVREGENATRGSPGIPEGRGPPGEPHSREAAQDQPRVHSGSVSINDQQIDVRENDTITSVISRINGMGAGLRAVFDARTETIRVFSRGSPPEAQPQEAIAESRGSPKEEPEISEAASEEEAESEATSEVLRQKEEVAALLAEIYGTVDADEVREIAESSPFDVDDVVKESDEDNKDGGDGARPAASMEARRRILERLGQPETREFVALKRRERNVGKKVNLRA